MEFTPSTPDTEHAEPESFIDSFAAWFEEDVAKKKETSTFEYLKAEASDKLAAGKVDEAQQSLKRYQVVGEAVIQDTAPSVGAHTRAKFGLVMSIGKIWRDNGYLDRTLDVLRYARHVANSRPQWPSVVAAVDIEIKHIDQLLHPPSTHTA